MYTTICIYYFIDYFVNFIVSVDVYEEAKNSLLTIKC